MINHHYDEAEPSPFPVKDTECEINNSESDNDYVEGEHGSSDDGADNDANENENDKNVPNIALNQYPYNPPSFMRALHLEVMYAPEFPKCANMSSDYTADGELCVGMQFTDRDAVV